MKTKENIELAHWVIGEAQKNGAADASVNMTVVRSVDIEHRDNKLDKLQESTENSLSLSIYSNDRFSNHVTNDLRKDSLAKFASEAVAMTRYLSVDPFRKLPDPKYYEGRQASNLMIFDSEIDSVTSEMRVAAARDLEKLTLAKSDLVVACTAYYSDSKAESIKVTSNGFEGSRRTTSFSYELETSMEDKGGAKPSDYVSTTVRMKKDIPDAESLAEKCIEQNKQRIGQTKLESGIYQLLIENRAASRILGAMRRPLSGHSIQQKRSFLEGKLGEKIASESLTIYDDPHVVGGLGSRHYDSEGMTARKRTIIEKGILKSYYLDTYYANKLGVEPTIGSATNTTFDYGDNSLDEMMSMIDKGILVTSFIGGNTNSTSGDYSYGIIGMYIENGKLIKPVNEMNISGNLIDLWNNLVAVGNDPYIYSSTRRPSLLFKDIQFSGV